MSRKEVFRQILLGRLIASPLEEEGATLVEYDLMVALIAIVAIVGDALLGDLLDSVFTQVSVIAN